MKIELKYLDVKRWKKINIEELAGVSIMEFMEKTDKTIVAAVFNGNSPFMYISNDSEWVETYREKGTSLHIKEIKFLIDNVFMNSDIPGIKDVASVFEGATMEVIENA